MTTVMPELREARAGDEAHQPAPKMPSLLMSREA